MIRKKQFWLMKSEPMVYSIDDLQKDGKTYWDGVRNFKARNYMKEMREGDGGLFYILAGIYYGVTVPVQPMKVIGASG